MFGVLLFIVAAALGVFGLLQHLKGKRILAAPFKKTGELAKNPATSDPKGAISTEGAVMKPSQALLSPCSKTECIYYEVEIRRHYEKTEQTQDGPKTKSGSESHTTLKDGALVQLDDGTGPFNVDFKQGADFDKMEKKFNEKVKLGMFVPGELQFGQLRMQTPAHLGSDRTVAYEAIEKVVAVGGNLFVLGKLENDRITKPGWRSMLASSKGRDGLLASTATKKKVGMIGGAVGAVLAIPAFIFSPTPEPEKADPNAAYCPSMIAGYQNKCHDNVGTSDDFDLTVDKETTYHVDVFPAKGKAYPFWPKITVKDATGAEVASQEGSIETDLRLDFPAKPGKYTIVVEPKDDPVTGGFDYDFAVSADGVGDPPAMADATKEPAKVEESTPETAVEMDAPVFAAKYLTNKADADAEFSGKWVKLKGLVAESKKDADRAQQAVKLVAPDEMGVKGFFEDGDAAKMAAGLKKNTTVTMTCKVLPAGEGVVEMETCTAEAAGKSVAAAGKGSTVPAKGKGKKKKK
jgi:hypothetical protein